MISLFYRFFEVPRVAKRVITLFFDSLFIAGAFSLALFVRLGSEAVTWFNVAVYQAMFVTVVASLIVWINLGLYRAVIRYIDVKVLSNLLVGSLASTVVLVAASFLLEARLPRSVPVIYFAVILIFTAGSRLFVRGLISAKYTNTNTKTAVIIYGAGASGRQLALSLQHGVEYNPVAFVDDNRELQNSTVVGIKVFSPDNLANLIKKGHVTKLLLAIPSVAAKQRKKLLHQLEGFQVEVLTIPGSADLVSGKLEVDTLRQIDIVELLGRDPVKPIDGLFRRCIENRYVMVTGAGGSIGSELCRQIVNQRPLELVLVESGELALYEIERELSELISTLDYSVRLVPILANVQDKKMIERVISRFSINTIYHAAAYKHVPIVEHNVISGVRNNVWGTLACDEAAMACEVENFVLISTDKAVRPTNVMGASKRLAELVLQGLSEKESKTRFSMVRFGNVLGSSGSVVPLFKKLIAQGGPITITHKDITRYFMTIPEAAQLVIQAGAMGKGGEVYVLDMGKSVKINDLAEKMIRLSGLTVKSESNPEGDIDIIYTGLRPGEKLYEELLIGENVEGTEHQLIMKAKEVSMSLDDLRNLLDDLGTSLDLGDIAKVREILLAAPLGFKPSSEIADMLWVQQSSQADGTKGNPDYLRVV